MSSSSAPGGGSPQAARRTLPHRTPTGHWAPQPQPAEPQLSAVCSLCICCITFNVTSFQLQGNNAFMLSFT